MGSIWFVPWSIERIEEPVISDFVPIIANALCAVSHEYRLKGRFLTCTYRLANEN